MLSKDHYSMILIVDGERMAGSSLERLLKYRGFDVTAAQARSEALALIDTRKPSGIILELNMDGVDGLTLLKSIRSDHTFDKVPVIIYTSAFADDMRRTVMEAGAQDYIVKGTIGWKSLVKRIERFCPRPRE